MSTIQKSCLSTSVVFLYHRMGYPKWSSLVAGQYVAPKLFTSELNYFSARGWKPVSLDEIVQTQCAEDSADKYCVTFDDGYLSVYEHAYPIMVQRKMKATVYVVADTIGGINEWDHRAGDQLEKMMTAQQVREMSDSGFEIGSHALSHPHLSSLDDKQLKMEIVDSKHKLEDLIGKEVTSFSYPYGDYDHRVLVETIAAGYKYAVTTKLGVVIEGTSAFEIPRVNVRWNAFGPFLMNKIMRARKASGL